jgi:predicted lipoprotein with Yx(FWY)xxD motif
MTETQRAASGQAGRVSSGWWPRLALRIAGAALLAATGAIHLDLYLTGYKSIPAIGWLFLLQVIAAFGLAAVVAVSGSRLAAAAGALFALSTLGGYLLSIWVGLFGFTEVRTTAGIVAGVIEVAAFAALAAAATLPSGPAGELDRPPASLKTVTIGGVRVLTSSSGLTLYWFAPDTPTTSACNGSCAAYWPPVKGPATAGAGVAGKLGTIKRSGGSLQATYNGHPLYTYIADTAPGQARGNNLNLNGGLWHEVTVP